MKFLSPILALATVFAFGACQSLPPYARDTKPHYANELKVELKNKVAFKTPEGALNQGTHILALMNFSSKWTCIAVSTDKAHWLNIATPIGRTCPMPVAQMAKCFNEGKFLPVGKVNCSQAIEVLLKFRDPQGNIGTMTTPYHLIPNCQDVGTTILFED
jgi:hypothetical protein